MLISGESGAGKSTFADYLQESLSYSVYMGQVHRLAFADELKMIARYDFGWDGRKDERGRRLLQMLGDAGREYNEQFWKDKLVDKVLRYLFIDSGVVIVDDCRYENEFYCLDDVRNLRVIKVRILRQENPNHLKGNVSVHSSEHGLDFVSLDAYDFLIENISLSELQESAEEVARYVVGKVLAS